jgi:rare lipoprotein A
VRTTLSVRSLVSVGALTVAIGIPAVALATGTSQAQSATVINLNPQRVEYGGEVTVTGTASTPASGQRVQLEFAPRGAAGWAPIASATTTGNGSFRIHADVFRSGLLRVVGATRATTATATPLASTGASGVQPSASQPVAVAARLDVRKAHINVLSGSPAAIRGRLLPGLAWRRVLLQARQGGGWQTVAHAYTRRGGRFNLYYVPSNLGTEHLRVRFPGDASSGRAYAYSGVLTVYRQSVASWYNDGGSTACGFHATYGVANKTLPCGTKVTFFYGGQQVTATVDDRGPFVPGRDWDFNQNIASALGMGGVATVWSSI